MSSRISDPPRAPRLRLHPSPSPEGKGLRHAPFALLTALALCGCKEQTDTTVLAKVEAAQREEAVEDGRVNCALNGAATFARVCDVDRQQSERGLLLTLRHPDGGFRRLLVTKDGRGVIAADGAQRAQVTIVDPNEIEVAIGRDIYRLPATVRAPIPAHK